MHLIRKFTLLRSKLLQLKGKLKLVGSVQISARNDVHLIFLLRLSAQHSKTPPSDGVSCGPDAPQDVKLALPEWAKSYRFTGDLRPAHYSPRRNVPPGIRKPDYADHIAGVSDSEQRDRTGHNNIRIYTSEELDAEYGLRHACRMGREVLDIAGKALRPGVTTDEIDRIVHEASIERDCYPSPLNYYNFPKSVCTSVNEVICHGIPDYREIEDGGKNEHCIPQ